MVESTSRGNGIKKTGRSALQRNTRKRKLCVKRVSPRLEISVMCSLRIVSPQMQPSSTLTRRVDSTYWGLGKTNGQEEKLQLTVG